MITDIHGAHIINHRYTPKKIYTDREWDLKHLCPLLWEALDHDLLVDIGEGIYNLFAKKDIDAQPIARLWFDHIESYFKAMLQEYKDAGIKRTTSLSIDFFPWDGGSDNIYNQWAAQKHLQLIAAPKFGIDAMPFMGIDPSHLEKDETLNFFEKNLPDFSGVKLYPAIWNIDCHPLGWHKVPQVVKIAEICNRLRKPLLIHCNTGGIGDKKENSAPKNWKGILAEYDNLKILFAHAGWGREEWRDQIVYMADLFETEEGLARVYVDTAFHDNAIHNPDNYFNDLRAYLERGSMMRSFVFGSDWPLFKIYKYNLSDLVKAYRDKLGEFIFENIAIWNPDSFLDG